MDQTLLDQWRVRAAAFEAEAHQVLGRHETAQSRVVILDDTYSALEELNLKQNDLFKQALRCAEHGLFRAAHVMAWAAFMDYLLERLAADDLVAVRRERPNWKGQDIHEMAEYVPERQFVEVTKQIGLCTKNQMAALVSLLQRRNECAHPSGYLPGLNETLGYISELLQRLALLSKRSLR